MKRVMWLVALMLVALTVVPTAADADFYVIPIPGGVGTRINSLPVIISQPGLYYLAKNLTYASPLGEAIRVEADDVTLDLMGFCLTGPGKDTQDNRGIYVKDGLSNVEIRNGSLKSFGGYGIWAGGTTMGIRVIGIRVRDTKLSGMLLPGTDNLVMDCSAINTGGDGIHASGSTSLVKGCHVTGNSAYGIYVGSGSTVMGNVAKSNGSGIWANFGSSVTDNSVYSNTEYGINTDSYCTVTRNTARTNPSGGIKTLTYCTITNNTTQGLEYGTDCTRANNTVAP